MNTIIHIGDIGTGFELEIVTPKGEIVNVSEAVSLTINFMRPNKTKVAKTASLSTDGSDGKIQYISQKDDIDAIGLWSMMGFVKFDESNMFYSRKTDFVVYPNIAPDV